MSVDPRTPVLVGTGQISRRVDRGEPPLEPVDLMVEALRSAEADAGAASSIMAVADSVRVVPFLSWRYRNPGALVAERLGAPVRETLLSTMGGNTPQSLVNQTCRDIVAGRADVVLLCGAEAWRTRTAARSADEKLQWTNQDEDTPAPEIIGAEFAMSHPGELAKGIVMPVQIYPLFEHALRHESGRSLDEHLVHISELWSRFSEVAATNPHAWIQESFTAEEIRTVTPDNRMVGFPYTKLMNSNNAVEQGAGVIMCSAEKATELGVPRDRWVFVHAGTDAHDHYFVSERENLHSSPAIRIAGAAAMELAGVGADDLKYVDLYSCFPSAVQISAAELGLSTDRDLTVTGGLSFAGGPWNNYVMHSVATMANVLRDDPGSVGLCSANGGNVSKHAFGIYSTDPPAQGFRHAQPQDEIDALPRRELADQVDGPVTIEAHTVMFDREGEPENGIVLTMLDDGRRAWGTSQDPAVLQTLVTDDLTGHPAKIDDDGTLRIA